MDHERDVQAESVIGHHTPGPWSSARVHCHEACVYVDDKSENEIAVVYARRFEVPRNINQAKADAALIAAAPDLLAALKEVMRWESSGFAPQSKARAAEMAYAAIAKATMTAQQPAKSGGLS